MNQVLLAPHMVTDAPITSNYVMCPGTFFYLRMQTATFTICIFQQWMIDTQKIDSAKYGWILL